MRRRLPNGLATGKREIHRGEQIFVTQVTSFLPIANFEAMRALANNLEGMCLNFVTQS